MIQTDKTAIVLRHAAYRDNDRMLTLFSPTHGRIEALCRGCRKPRSALLGASELFALGDYELYEKGGHYTVTGARMIETFFPLREDFDRLACGTYLLSLCEAAIQPGQQAQELFMLLLHTLSRLTFTAQEWKPLLSGFLLHYADCTGIKPRLNHCIRCGRRLEETENAYWNIREDGLCCAECHEKGMSPVGHSQIRWMRHALQSGSASWVNTGEEYAPFQLLRNYVESRLDHPLRSAAMLPRD